MATIKTTPTDCLQRRRIFKTLTDLLKSQKSQIEALVDDRYILEKYINIQHDHWSAKCNLLESHITQLKGEEEKFRKLNKTKLDLVVEIRNREAFCYKKYSEISESDLADFHACMETLNAEFFKMKGNLNAGASGSKDIIAIEGEVRRLEHSCEKLNSEKEAEISALLTEKDLVSNQLKIMESDYISILESKKTEVDQANEAAVKHQNNLQELQVKVTEKNQMIIELEEKLELATREHNLEAEQANTEIKQLKLDNDELNLLVKEKDGIIMKLRNDLAKVELDMKSRFSKKRSEKGLSTPSKPGSSKQITKLNQRSSAPSHGLVRWSGKRRNMSADSSRERSRLFHANFKVPKLKDSPSPMPC